MVRVHALIRGIKFINSTPWQVKTYQTPALQASEKIRWQDKVNPIPARWAGARNFLFHALLLYSTFQLVYASSNFSQTLSLVLRITCRIPFILFYDMSNNSGRYRFLIWVPIKTCDRRSGARP